MHLADALNSEPLTLSGVALNMPVSSQCYNGNVPDCICAQRDCCILNYTSNMVHNSMLYLSFMRQCVLNLGLYHSVSTYTSFLYIWQYSTQIYQWVLYSFARIQRSTNWRSTGRSTDRTRMCGGWDMTRIHDWERFTFCVLIYWDKPYVPSPWIV